MAAPTRALFNETHQRILVHLRRGPLRWRDLHALTRPRNDPALAANLHKLVRDGLILPTMEHAGPPARVSYTLTKLGRELADRAATLIEWVEKNIEHVERSRGAAMAEREIERVRRAQQETGAAR
jgi:DNA-binding HxlR family transcriptional regulator